MTSIVRLALFLVSVVLLVLGLISMFARYDRNIDRAKVLESLAMALGLAGIFAEMHNKPT